MSPVRLIGIDVDGTLVGASGNVLPAVWNAAERVRNAGIHLALCSGRPAFGLALDYARRLDPRGWHIFQNGASVIHLDSGRSLSSPVDPASVRELVSAARTSKHVLELYSDQEYVAEINNEWARKHAELLGIPFEPRAFETLTGPVVRAQWLVSPDEAPEFVRRAPAQMEVAQSTSPIMPDTRFIGLTQAGVSKGSAMQTIAQAYEIPMEHVMYVGDAGNDLSALRVVGVPVAMANADAAVLAAAKHVAGDVEDGGLIIAMELALKALETR